MNPKNTLLLFLLIIVSVFSYTQDFWQHINTTPDSSLIRCMSINADGEIYIGMKGFDYPGGIYKSVNEGQSWEYLGLNDLPVFTIEFVTNGDIIAGVEDGMYKSNDNGASWYEVYHEIENVFNILSLPNGYVFAGGGGNLHGILRSTDFGETWDTNYVFPSTVNENLHALAISSEGYIYAGSKSIFGPGGIYKTIDLGETWEQFDYPALQVRSLAFHPSGDLYAGSVGEGLYRYNFNSQQWSQLVNWVSIETIFFVGYDKIFLGCTSSPYFDQGVLFSNDGGLIFNWLNSGIFGGEGIEIYNICQHPNEFVYAQGAFLYKSYQPIYTHINDQFYNNIGEISNFPNPFIIKTIIYWDKTENEELVNLIVTNNTGKIVLNKQIENTGNYVFISRFFKPGILYYSIVSDNKTCSGKMVLVK